MAYHIAFFLCEPLLSMDLMIFNKFKNTDNKSSQDKSLEICFTYVFTNKTERALNG